MTGAVRRFYGNHVTGYDWLARFTPGVRRWRGTAVDALALDPGDTVVDVGCGTGASLPFLREAVGASGRVIGVDVTRPLLERAQARATAWPNVSVVAADGATLPIADGVDGVLGSFVVGLFDDPAAAVQHWGTVLAGDGRIALLDGSPLGWAPPLDWVFGHLVRAGAPTGPTSAVLDRLTRRVDAAHGHLRTRGTDVLTQEFALGYVHVTAATSPERTA